MSRVRETATLSIKADPFAHLYFPVITFRVFFRLVHLNELSFNAVLCSSGVHCNISLPYIFSKEGNQLTFSESHCIHIYGIVSREKKKDEKENPASMR